jgi:hypothetical protein
MAGTGCCGGASCACAIDEGTHISVTGVGSSQDPFVIAADFDFAVTDNDTFNLSLSGVGSSDSPYVLAVSFASTASVADLPDWSDTPPTNGQVPVWSTGLSQWVPGSATPAASGSVDTDTSLAGDGSPGLPLEVVHDPIRFTETTVDGVGLTDDGINSLVRRFPNAAARTAADPAPDLDTLSMLDSTPGLLDYWDGSAWVPQETLPTVTGGALLELSGAYAGGRVQTLVKQLSATTDADGLFTILDGTDLAGAAGVLSVTVQPTGTTVFGSLATGQPGYLQGTAYRLDTGAAFAAQPITATVTALLY